MTIPQTAVDVAQLASQLVQTPSVNPMGKDLPAEICGEHRVTDFLAQLFSSWGIPCERHVVTPAADGRPSSDNLVALVQGNVSEISTPPLLLMEVHQDTVPVDGMVIPPWSGEIRDGRIHGRGACDIKGGMASLLATMARLIESRPSLNANVVVAFTVNEEHGFTGAQHLQQMWQNGTSKMLPRAPDAIIVTEPTQLNVVTTHKGCLRWKCRTQGRAAHSSTPHEGTNAIYAMAHVVNALEHYAMDVVPNLASHPSLSPPSLSVGTITGGISVNTVPDACSIEIDRRVTPQEDPQAAYRHVLEYVREQCSEIDVEHGEPFILAPGLSDQHNGKLADALVTSVRGHDIACSQQAVAYGTDAAVLARNGIPAVVFGPGSVAQAHTADEWVDIEQLRAAVDILHDFAIGFADIELTGS